VYIYDQSTQVDVKYYDVEGKLLQTSLCLVRVIPDTVAARLGLRVMDVLESHDGRKVVNSVRFLLAREAARQDGRARKVTVLRGGKRLTYEVPGGVLGIQIRDCVLSRAAFVGPKSP
jgi:S1-C subfamily serine protease